MNILIVTGKMDEGGAETHVLELAKSLVELGHSLTVASAGGRLANELCRAGVSHLRLPLDKKTPWAIIECTKKLTLLAKARNFHIIHAHTRISAAVAWRVSRKLGVRMVSTIHARFRMGVPWKWLSRWGDSVIAVSQDLGQYLLSHGDVLAENVTVIPNGIDTERFFPNERVSERARRVVFLSRLDADCSAAALSLCRIAQRLQKHIPDVEIIIAGGGSEYQRIETLSRRINGEAGRRLIVPVGKVENAAELLKNADIFVGVSRAALEAMSCGVPTVIAGDEGFLGALDTQSLRLARQSNFCARGQKSLTDEALFKAIVELSGKSREQRKALGEELRQFVVHGHSIKHVGALTQSVYSKTYRQKKRGGQGVLLCGYYGYGNMGDDLLLVRAIERAERAYPTLPIRALTANGKRDTRKFGVDCARRASFLRVIYEIRRARTVVFGGGTLLQNSTSRRSVWYYLFILLYAQRKGKTTQLWGNGIGWIKGRHARRMTARALAGCQFVGLRDKESVSEALALICQNRLKPPRMELEDDLALRSFDVSDARMEYITSMLGIHVSERIAVVSFRGSGSAETVRRMSRWVRALKKDGILPVYIVMYPDEDLSLCKDMCARLGGVVAYPLGASDIVGLMRMAKVALGMRYHALVLASIAGVPFVGFGREPKIQRFCHSHGGAFVKDL